MSHCTSQLAQLNFSVFPSLCISCSALACVMADHNTFKLTSVFSLHSAYPAFACVIADNNTFNLLQCFSLHSAYPAFACVMADNNTFKPIPVFSLRSAYPAFACEMANNNTSKPSCSAELAFACFLFHLVHQGMVAGERQGERPTCGRGAFTGLEGERGCKKQCKVKCVIEAPLQLS